MPVVKEDEILVKVYGTSVNPVDAGIRRGSLKGFVRLNLPAVLGVDVSGEVVEVGKKVTKFKRGDKVYAFTGITKNGGYGEYITLPDSFAATVPQNLNIIDAGVVPGVGMTAYEAFTIHAPITPGMKVLINGATGGVGTYAIQIAKHFGAQVTAVCSTEKVELAKGLGADKIIDYKKQNILKSEEKYDIILNCVRGIGFRKFLRLLRPGGKSLVIAGRPLEIPLITLSNLFTFKKTIPFFVKTDGRLLEGLSNLIREDKVKPVIEKTYLWKDLALAHRHVETGKIAGKIGVSMVFD
jgi:NADPH:quinone reductase-like Zn-dependent oxidoreductase